jgi:WD40 repeat protein
MAKCMRKQILFLWSFVIVTHALGLDQTPIHPFHGHVLRVLYVDFSPDDKFIVTCGEDRTARIWDVQSGEVIRILRHDGPVHYAKFSPDGKLLATVSDFSRLNIWRTDDWQKIREVTLEHGRDTRFLGGYGGGAVSLSEDFSRVAVFKGSIIEVWDLNEGKKIFQDDARISAKEKGYGYAGWVGNWYYNTVCLSPDGKKLAATVYRWYPEVVRVWDVETGNLLFDLKGHTHSCGTCVTFSKDGQFLASGSRDTTVIVWDLKEGSAIHRFFGPKEWAWVDSVAFSPDGRLIAAGYFGENWVRVFDVAKGEEVAKIDYTPLWIDSPVSAERVAFSHDGKLLAIASGEGVGTWETNGWKLVKIFATKIRDTLCARFSPTGNQIVFGDYYGCVRVFDIESKSDILSIRIHKSPTAAVAFSPDGKFVASGDESGNVAILDISGRKVIKSWTAHQRPIRSLNFSPDGNAIVTGSWDGRARLWDIRSGEMKGEFSGKLTITSNPAYCLDFSEDGSLLAVGFADGVRIFDINSGSIVKWIEDLGVVRALKFVPKTRILFVASWAKGISLFDGNRGFEQIGISLNDWRGKERFAIAIPSPTQLDKLPISAVGGRDGKVVLIPLSELALAKEQKDVKQMPAWLAHDAFVASLDFSPDGKLLLSSGTDGVVRIWDANSGKLLLEISSFGPGQKDIIWRTGGEK